MYSNALVVVNIPASQESEAENMIIRDRIESLQSGRNKASDDIQLEQLLEKVNNLRARFSSAVTKEVDMIMDKYVSIPSDPCHLEFEDKTEYLRKEYERKENCIMLPQGTIIEASSFPFREKFIIRDGRVYQKWAGQLKQEKRTKKAKKMTVLPSYPVKNLYKDISEYAHANYSGTIYDEENQRWGSYWNPNSICESYQEGKFWPHRFLVKSSCTECSFGKNPLNGFNRDAPDGYIWVNAARKKDIQWQAIREWYINEIEKMYIKHKTLYDTGQISADKEWYQISDDGLRILGPVTYYPGLSMDAYIKKIECPRPDQYPVEAGDIIDYETYRSSYNSSADKERKKDMSWEEEMDEYIGSLNDNAVLVGVDLDL